MAKKITRLVPPSLYSGEYIEFSFSSLPVSVNKLYINIRGNRRILSSEGKKFKNKFITSMGGASPQTVMAFDTDPTKAYRLIMEFYLKKENLFNLTYGKDKRVKSLFKNVDTSNLIKITEDSIAELLGLKDCTNFEVLAAKRLGTVNFEEGIRARLYKSEDPLWLSGWLQ